MLCPDIESKLRRDILCFEVFNGVVYKKYYLSDLWQCQIEYKVYGFRILLFSSTIEIYISCIEQQRA